jgi:transposase-like protein
VALPITLKEAIIYFADTTNCNRFVADLRWVDGRVRCPHCDSDNVVFLVSVNRYKCYGKHPRAQFSLKVDTIFEDSPLGLDKWLCAIWLIVNCKNGISSCEMARDLCITQKSAWFLDHRIRFALHNGGFEKMLSGELSSSRQAAYLESSHRQVRKRRNERSLERAPTPEAR